MRYRSIPCRPTLSQIEPPNFLNNVPKSSPRRAFSTTLSRSARFIPRPQRPYTFTQLVALSDGSTYLHRTTSPAPLYRSTRDTRNAPMWNPSNARIANIEVDDAGRLRAFRRRFGRSWDSGGDAASLKNPNAMPAGSKETGPGSRNPQTLPPQRPEDVAMPGDPTNIAEEPRPGDVKNEAEKQAGKSVPASARKDATADRSDQEDDNLMDLISSYGAAGYQPPVDHSSSKPESKKKK